MKSLSSTFTSSQLSGGTLCIPYKNITLGWGNYSHGSPEPMFLFLLTKQTKHQKLCVVAHVSNPSTVEATTE